MEEREFREALEDAKIENIDISVLKLSNSEILSFLIRERKNALSSLHDNERKIDIIDYLIHEIKKEMEEKNEK